MKRVLLIDDDQRFLQALARELLAHGYRVDEAADGLEGIDKAMQEPPDFAVVDLIMPRVGGGEVVSFFRQNPYLASTPIVLLSGVLAESAPAVDAIEARRSTPASTSSWGKSTVDASGARGHGRTRITRLRFARSRRARSVRASVRCGQRRGVELDELIPRYPQKMAALLPALWIVQRERGWVSDEGMAEVAGLLDLTPAYVKGVVTFYTMYHQHPVGKYFIQVCTTSPCGICGAEDVAKAFLATPAPASSASRLPTEVHRHRGRMPRRLRLRDAGDDQRRVHRIRHAGKSAGTSLARLK